MICIITEHFSIIRILLLLVGLWPYQQTRLARLQAILIFSILISIILFQITVFLTAECTFDLFITVFSNVLLFSGALILFISFWFNIRTVKCLLDRLQEICNKIKDVTEIAIIRRYGYKAKRLTVFLLLFLFCVQVIIITLPIWPRLLGIFLFLNESRLRRRTFIVTEYFVHEGKYFHLILLHANVAICTTILTIIAISLMLLVSLKHACGMFSIASYRIERAIARNMIKNVNLRNQEVICKKMIYAIDIHRRAILSIFQLALSGNDKEDLLVRLLCTVLLLLYMFVANEIGQEITDHNNQVYFAAYKVRWYAVPLHVQKLILFLIQRGNKTFGLRVGGLFIASLECFATLASASISYFTVLYSMQ